MGKMLAWLTVSVLAFYCWPLSGAGITADHNCIQIGKIPKKYIELAKSKFRIAYGHTSHGSQIVSGMLALAKSNPLFRYVSRRKAAGAFLWDRIPAGDLGNPDQQTWAKRTHEMLKTYGKDRNVVMWSWCGQLSRKNTDVNKYLKLMSQLEKEFPKVIFIYMTGHLDGRGTSGILHRNNEKIRKFCHDNNKILFDFADIESYDPDGKINYNELSANDGCFYRKNGRKMNWASEWISKNPEHDFKLPPSAAHTHPLNGAMKGNAFWWLMARIAGWTPERSSKIQ